MADWVRDAARYTAMFNTGRRVYNTLASGARYVYDNWSPQQQFWDINADGSVNVAASREDADSAYIRRAMGYRLNPDSTPAIGVGSRSRSSVGHVFYGL